MLNRDLSHLSWGRVEAGTPDHYPERIADDVVEVMGTFVERLQAQANPAAEWFDGPLLQARELLKESPVPGRNYTTSGAYEHVVSEHLPHVPTAGSPGGPTAGALARQARTLLAGALELVERFVDAMRSRVQPRS
jgi:hypothetical protein